MSLTRDDFKQWQDRFHGPIQDTLKQIFDEAGRMELGFSVSPYFPENGSAPQVYASLFNMARFRGESDMPIPAGAIEYLENRIAESLPEQGVKVNVRNCDHPIGP